MNKRKLIIIASVAVIVAVLLFIAGYFFWKYTELKKNPDVIAQETSKLLVEKINKLYALPGDEEPTVAKIKDKSKLGDQEFFKNAENDDYILIYTNGKLALIYREKENKLINVGPISIDSESSSKKADNPSTP